MPIDKRILKRTQDFITLGLLALAMGGGLFLLDGEVSEQNLNTIDVGWWNIRKLSNRSRDETEIEQIAEVIKHPEVLAIGEVLDSTVLGRLVETLGPSWDWAVTQKKIGETPRSKEYYGFLWNTEAVIMVDSIHVDPDPDGAINREPVWATFRTVNNNLDFTVIAVHIRYDGGEPKRREEITALKDVWKRVQEATPDDDDLILVGDFNLDIGDTSFQSILSISGLIRANEYTGPTNIYNTHSYDQIFISLEDTKEWTGEFVTIRFDEIFFDNDRAAANLAVSDHRPIWITLFVPESDDD